MEKLNAIYGRVLDPKDAGKATPLQVWRCIQGENGEQDMGQRPRKRTPRRY